MMDDLQACIRCKQATRLKCPGGCLRPLCSFCADSGLCGACQQANVAKVEVFDSPAERSVEIEMSNGNIVSIVHSRKTKYTREHDSIAFYESREQESPAALIKFRKNRLKKVIDNIIA